MARLFDDALSDHLQHDAAIVTAVPLSMACWFRSDSLTTAQTLMAVENSASAAARDIFLIDAAGQQAGDPVRAGTASPTQFSAAASSAGFSANTWHHAAGVFASATSRAAYIDGGSKGTEATSRVPSGINRANIGALRQATTANFMSGDIAEAAIWDVALTDDEVLILSKGYSPLFVRPANLVAYWPLLAYSSPELDRVGGFGMTVTGAVKSDHPRIIYPSRRRLILPAAAVAQAPGFPMYELFVGSGGFAA